MMPDDGQINNYNLVNVLTHLHVLDWRWFFFFSLSLSVVFGWVFNKINLFTFFVSSRKKKTKKNLFESITTKVFCFFPLRFEIQHFWPLKWNKSKTMKWKWKSVFALTHKNSSFFLYRNCIDRNQRKKTNKI